jgi:hypothetical protein
MAARREVKPIPDHVKASAGSMTAEPSTADEPPAAEDQERES